MKQMKYTFAGLLLCCNFLQAQTDSTTKKERQYELGTNVYAMIIQGGDFYSQYKKTMDNSVFNGLYFKIYKGKNAMRYSFDYYRRLNFNMYYPLKKLGPSFYNSSASVQLSAGYQRLLTTGRFAPYLIADATLGSYRHTLYGSPWFADILIAPGSYTGVRRGYLAGLSAGAGVRIKFGRHLVLNAESLLQGFYARERAREPGQWHNMIGVNGKPLMLTFGVLF